MLANLAPTTWSATRRRRMGNAHQNIVPYQVFEVPRGDRGKDSILAVGNDGQYAKFCEVAGRPRPGQRAALCEECRPRAPPRRAGPAAGRR